jgi:hypothetical protein
MKGNWWSVDETEPGGRDEVGVCVSDNESFVPGEQKFGRKKCLFELRHVEDVGQHACEHPRCS